MAETEVQSLFTEASAEATEDVSATEAKQAGVSTSTAKAVLEQYEEKCKNDPTLEERAFSLSESLELVKTLGTHSKSSDIASSIVVDQAATKENLEKLIASLKPKYVAEGMSDEEAIKAAKKEIKDNKDSKDPAIKEKYAYRKVVGTQGICGYVFKNVGTTPIQYISQKCTKGEDGKWTVEKVHEIAQPGKEFMITRQNAVLLGTAPEFSFKFKNARVTAKNKEDVDAYLKSSYISFSTKGVTVHDESVKVVIDKVDKNGDIKVLKDYQSMFGYLENKVEKPVKEPKTPKTAEDRKKASSKLQAAIADSLFSQINNI